MVTPARTVARAESQTTTSGNDTAAGGAGARVPTRQRILRAGLELFATRGFDGTDIVDIEETVGLTPGSGGFYRHFRNKEDLLRSVIETEIQRVREHQATLIETRAQGEPAPDIEIADRIEHMLEMLWEMRQLLAVISHENDRFPDLLPQIASAMADSGVEIGAADLSRLMDVGVVPQRPADAVASIVLMAGIGFTLTSRLFGRPIADVDRERFGRVLTDLVLGRPSA